MFMRSFLKLLQTRTFSSKLIPFNLADIGEGITEVQIIKWFVKEGQAVSQFDKLAEVQSDKATVEITSRYDGVIKKLHYARDSVAKVGLPLVDIEIESSHNESIENKEIGIIDPAANSDLSHSKKVDDNASDSKNGNIPLATPAVRNLARTMGIPLDKIKQGTGKGGRITKEDILSFGEKKLSQQESTIIKEAVPLSMVQKAMVKSMAASLSIPHFGYSDDFNVTKLNSLRKKILGPAFSAKHDRNKLTLMTFFIKAASISLKEFPILNARLSDDLSSVIYNKDHNFGIAMDTPMGLLVPVLKKVQLLGISQIATALAELSADAKEGKCKPDDFLGSTFSLSNIGSIGGTVVSPILVPPQVCIGAMGKVQKVADFEAELYDSASLIKFKEIIQVSFSADHRLIDGATMAKFSNRMKYLLEEPSLLLLEMQ